MNSTVEIVRTVCIALVPTLCTLFIFFRYNKFIQASEAAKTIALGDVSFVNEATYKLYSSGNKKLLELEVKTTNISIKKMGVLAIFVRFKPIINKSLSVESQLINFSSLVEFKDESSLSQLINIAHIKGSLWQMTVNEIMANKRFDIVDEEFCNKHPLLMAEIRLLCCAMDFIDKTHFPKYKIDALRVPFCNYLEQKNSENYNFFSKMDKKGYKSKDFCVKEAERILINKDGSIDIENTKKFFPILKSVVGASLEKVIDLTDADIT